jgi:hypothetical protein
LEKNEMQIDGEDIENPFVNTMFRKKKKKKKNLKKDIDFKRHLFMPFYLKMG